MAVKNGGCGGSVLCEMRILGSEISVLIYVSSSRVIWDKKIRLWSRGLCGKLRSFLTCVCRVGSTSAIVRRTKFGRNFYLPNKNNFSNKASSSVYNAFNIGTGVATHIVPLCVIKLRSRLKAIGGVTTAMSTITFRRRVEDEPVVFPFDQHVYIKNKLRFGI